MNRIVALMLGAVAACAPLQDIAEPPADLALFGGYRSPEDPCQRAGETALTNRFLDDAADLVACPQGYEKIALFQKETGAILVAEHSGFVLFSVPRR